MWLGGTYLNYSRILLTALYEFIISKLCVLVSIHICENLVYTLGIQGQVGKGNEKGRETFSGVSSSAGGLTI